jgi:large repetitive protein
MKNFVLVLTVLFLASGVASAELRAWYKFDETSGRVVNDSSGNGFHTFVNAAPIWDPDGAVDGCLSNDYAYRNQWITVPTEVFSTMDQQATFSWWVQRTSLYDDGTASTSGQSSGGLFSGVNSGGTEMIAGRLYYSSENKWYMWYKAGSSTVNWWWDYQNVEKDEWIHLAVVFDGIAGTKTLYANGQVAGTVATQSGESLSDIAAFNFFTRTSKTNGGDWWDSFHGKMDDFRIYDHALTQAEVMTLVPEPTTIALLGLGGLALIRRKK